jgi:hypothetical protein
MKKILIFLFISISFIGYGQAQNEPIQKNKEGTSIKIICTTGSLPMKGKYAMLLYKKKVNTRGKMKSFNSI